MGKKLPIGRGEYIIGPFQTHEKIMNLFRPAKFWKPEHYAPSNQKNLEKQLTNNRIWFIEISEETNEI
jgi:hypothetical protein